MRVAFSFTHVEYESRDPIGWILALVSLAPFFVLTFLATLTVFRREVHALFCGIGLVANDILSSRLKKVSLSIASFEAFAARPPNAPMGGGGLPSSHAQFAGFVLGYSFFLPANARILRALSVLFLTLTCVSRLYLNYHSPLQVLAGSLVGIGLGAAYSIPVSNSVVDRVEKSSFGSRLHLRDSLRSPQIFAKERELTLVMPPPIVSQSLDSHENEDRWDSLRRSRFH
mmetsp:Transcript_17725/g.25552  ORF Transcript_17725/g.25552 Transcript_17725/m.25552 type:complete len:228 (-) Transcript_17725:3827-4510(-)